MRVISIGALCEPAHQIKSFGAVEGELVAIEEIGDDSVIAIGCVLVGDELGVLPANTLVFHVYLGD